MKRLALAASAACLIAVTVAAPAVSQSTTVDPTTHFDPCATHHHPAAEQRALAHRAFARRRWRHPEPGKGNVHEMRILRSCADRKAIPAMRKSWREAKAGLYRYRTLRRIAPFPGYHGYGLGLTWLAVPRSIVDCEGGPDWNRPNSSGSGAYGPYQLLGHGEPIPVNSWHDEMVTHRIAAELYAESGTSPWTSSAGCWG